MDRIASFNTQIIKVHHSILHFHSYFVIPQNDCFLPDLFAKVELAPADPILGTAIAYKADTSKTKLNLGVGAYRDDNEKPYPFKVVRQVDLELAQDPSVDKVLFIFIFNDVNVLLKEYLPIDGLQQFNDAAKSLVFGADNPAIKEGRVILAALK